MLTATVEQERNRSLSQGNEMLKTDPQPNKTQSVKLGFMPARGSPQFHLHEPGA